MDIQTTLLTSLRTLAEQHTAETLGDRSEYLGASEIGYCPRKVILEKIHPSEHDLATLLRFQRKCHNNPIFFLRPRRVIMNPIRNHNQGGFRWQITKMTGTGQGPGIIGRHTSGPNRKAV